ncbi:hypothetical protein SAMN05192558_10540 [Actinokineospora alba]|uniref:Uncharacterized protein n=1 Tax=Actinokineospora alba TaxID=504798 RepID=A0A1H0MT38_9PSEU|nr:hypothetical protein [Actinokineospora alba]TDP68413.1 hypothetical protein C8E96_3978 [Actinokineospora alba]SDH78603.1 hypothetical protein SAMN05421871_10290 [Actinokineospora alba]SDO83290.1 hypothetical protein SAMN05192558_10540 [Actinokineospora alba]
MSDQREAKWDGANDGDPFATGGHGRFMQDGAAPSVIGASSDDVDETVRVNPDDVRYDREPPTSPIPVADPGTENPGAGKKSWFGKLFGR